LFPFGSISIGCRQFHGERASFAGSAVYADRALVGIDDELRYAQTQSTSLGSSREAAVNLVESLEYLFYRSTRYTYTIIANTKTNGTIVLENSQFNVLVIIRIFVGIVQQVHEHRNHGVPISHHIGQILADIGLEFTLAGAEFGLYRLGRIAGDLGRARPSHLEGLLVPLHPGEAEEVIDQSGESFVFLRDQLQVLRDLPLVAGSKVRLEQVFLNIVLNAVQQMEHERKRWRGGRFQIRIATGLDAGAGRPIWVRLSDSGPGIHYQLWDKVFALGFSTRPGGTGLGLFIARSLVESLGGAIRVEESLVPGGTTFLVRLPAAEA